MLDRSRRLVAVLGLIAASGCTHETTPASFGDSNADPDSGPGMSSSADTTSLSSSSSVDTTSLSSSSDDGSTDPPGDTGRPSLDLRGAETSEDTTCNKVDLLFVVDTSNSMSDVQDNLVANFSELVDGIENELAEVDDVHIGVTTTSDYPPNQPPQCQPIGGLVATTAGATCGPFAEGGQFMTLADDLPTAFPCAALVGGGGHNNERQAEAMLRGVGPELAAPGACNEGFLRHDALLVVVLISDEDDGFFPDQGSAGDPQDWFDALVAIKGGIETNVVVLSLLGLESSLCLPQAPGAWEASIGLRLIELTEMFTYGTVGDICAPSYGQFFADAVSVVDVACIDFRPAG